MHRFLRLTILLAGMFVATGSHAAGQPFTGTEDQLGPEVPQPIEFPHNRHAGKGEVIDSGAQDPTQKYVGMEINCMYCHTYARRSMVSGIPPLRKCIGCHQSIESVREAPRIKKLFEYWEGTDGKDAQKPVPWLKVHDLPDFVRFNHERHIQRFYFQQGKVTQDEAGGNDGIREVCSYCHGDIAAKNATVARRQKPITMGWCANCHQKDHAVDATGTETARGPNDCFTCHK
ncbi:MAG: hypothetical protein LBE50_06420 [Gallionellaceae bacterium]|jgi:hypothetical protein|nr:hypothetical protein [Gallionellaceae bacterium]